MLFSSGLPQAPRLDLLEAALRGFPEGGGLFSPAGEAELRTLVYAPELSFSDTAALGASALFPESLDPLAAAALAEAAFSREPPVHLLDEEILLVDLAAGPTGSAADYLAAFCLALLGKRAAAEDRILVGALRPREALAFSEAARSHPGLPLVLLAPEEEAGRFRSLLGEREGLRILGVRGGRATLRALERELGGAAFRGRPYLPFGAGNPARFAAIALLLLALFTLGRKGLSGDLLMMAPARDDEALAAGLWAWSWGLPVSAYLRPEAGALGEASGRELLEGFPLREALASLVIEEGVDAAESAAAGRELAAAGWPAGGSAAADALAVARRVLARGYEGHARVILPRLSVPVSPLREAPRSIRAGADALIDPSLPSLESALASLR